MIFFFKETQTAQGSASDFCSLFKNQVNLSFIFLFDHPLFSLCSTSTFCFFIDQRNRENDRRRREGKEETKTKHNKTPQINEKKLKIPQPFGKEITSDCFWVFLPLFLSPSRNGAWRTLVQVYMSQV